MRRSRRALDLVVAVPVAVLSAPLVFVLVVAASVTSGAPGIYRQTRIGRGGHPFNIFKIRSMRPSKKPGGTTITTSSDPRITPFGAQLRRFKLDELPQLWNVVAGQMSLVGPRPDVPGYADVLVGDDREMLKLRPGITGPASLVFRAEEQLLADAADAEVFNNSILWPEKVAINVAYARHATLWDDLRLLVLTLRSDHEALARLVRKWDSSLAELEIAGTLLHTSP